MGKYLLKRLLLIVPTLFGIMLINFAVIQFAPGGPIERIAAQMSGIAADAGAGASALSGGGGDMSSDGRSHTHLTEESAYSGLPPDIVADLEKQFGFDKPVHERFFLMLGNYLVFDFGDSYFKNMSVTELILDKMPVSISLGLWTTLIVYGLSIPMGIRKAVRDGTRFDAYSSLMISLGYAVPSFLLAVFLVIMFAGGSYLDWFPLRGLVSDDWETLTLGAKIIDYFWHITLPVIAMSIGGFATLTMLTKNSFMEEIRKQYVTTARAKGCPEKTVLYGHIFRNAMLIIISGFPAAFVSIFFTGALIIETIFSLDGLGLLGFEAVLNRDYPVMFGTLYIFSLIGLVMNVISDVVYVLIDPRIDFESRI